MNTMTNQEKLDIGSITVGKKYETTFWANPSKDSDFRFRATHLDGKRAPKVVLCDDARIQPGKSCLVQVARVGKPDRSDRGAIEVEFVKMLDFRIEGIWLDPDRFPQVADFARQWLEHFAGRTSGLRQDGFGSLNRRRTWARICVLQLRGSDRSFRLLCLDSDSSVRGRDADHRFCENRYSGSARTGS